MIRRLLIIFSLILFAQPAHSQDTLSVRIIADADDSLGSQLSYAIRREISQNPEFRLVYDDSTALRVRFVTVAPASSESPTGQTHTVYSLVITLYASNDDTEIFFKKNRNVQSPWKR